MKNKVINIFLIFTLLFFICNTTFAATISSSKTTMSVVDESICEIKLKDYGNFIKKLTKFDKDKKQVTLTLTLENIAEKENITKPIELFLILDNSNSMTLTYQNKAKKEYVTKTANAFVDSLFNYFENTKVGIISFSSIDTTLDENANLSLGTENDAKLLLNLSESKDTIKNTINNYADNKGPFTNIEAGLSIAEKNFTTGTDSEKYVVLISDGVPNLCLNTSSTLTYSGIIATNTKNKLVEMKNKGYHMFSVLMGLSESNTPNPSAPTISDGSRHMTYRELAEEIFGTSLNPTAGEFYYIDYNGLSSTLNTNIYEQITYSKDKSLKNIVIKDYFPKEIIENFNFEYEKTPNIGNVSTKIDTTDNSITWTIESLKEGEIATLSYNLTLKDEYNEEILDTIIPTNSKVDINFETDEGKGNSFSDTSPKVKLVTEKEVETSKEPEKNETKEPEITVNTDNTVATDPIPQTGLYNILFTILISTISVFIIIKVKKLNDLNK